MTQISVLYRAAAPEGAPGGTGPIWAAAAAAGVLRELSVEQRRRRFLRSVRDELGPCQFRHLTGHCEEVARAAVQLARLMQMEAEIIEAVRLAGLLHDIGKALVPEPLLAKAGPLSRSERAVMDCHAADGARLCRAMGACRETGTAVRHHHTRFDAGEGSLAGQIVCVADALVTMTTDRPYSAARSFCDALGELRAGRGTLFNPRAVVAAHMLARGSHPARRGSGSR